MPPLAEGDLLYMPSALPGLSADRPRNAQQTDKVLMQFPEVRACVRQMGRAETATDPGGPGNVRDHHPVSNPNRNGPSGKTQDQLSMEMKRH